MTDTLELRSAAIHCDGCAASIQRSLGKLAGVQSATVDVERKTVRVVFDPAQATESGIRERLAAAGFPVD